MNIKQAISLVKQNINDSIYNKKPFKMLKCGETCGCVKGIKWDNITFEPNIIITPRFRFKLSMDTSNDLEYLYLPLIQPSRLGQSWENDRVVME